MHPMKPLVRVDGLAEFFVQAAYPLAIQRQQTALGGDRWLAEGERTLKDDCETGCTESLFMHQGGAGDERLVASIRVGTRILKRWVNMPETWMVVCGAVWSWVSRGLNCE